MNPIRLTSGPQRSNSARCERDISSGVDPLACRPAMARLSITALSFKAALMAALAAAIVAAGVRCLFYFCLARPIDRGRHEVNAKALR